MSRILRAKIMLNGCEIDLVTVIDAALETVCLSAKARNIDLVY
jgi:signal transduction histidine kinase